MLANLFISKVRIKLLNLFLTGDDEELHVRAIVRTLDEEINAVRRELQNLHSIGLLTWRKSSNKKFFKLNERHLFVKELRELAYKNRNDVNLLYKSLEKFEEIEVALLTDDYLQRENEKSPGVDLLIVGTPNLQILTKELKNVEKSLGIELKVSALSNEDLLFALKKRDEFILNILDGEGIYLIGNKIKLS